MKSSRNYILGEVLSNNIITTIKFSGVPSSINVTRPLIKFGKKNWLSLEWDDASIGSIAGLEILNSKHYTDGCGNNINYKAAIAFNGAYEGTGVEYPYDSGLTVEIMKSMIDYGWDFEDHGYYHDPVGFGANITPYQSTVMMRDFGKRLLNYWLRGKVVPQNYEGHATAAKNLGYLFSTSQGTFDAFVPEWLYAPPGNYATLPSGFAAIRRDFTDDWTNTTGMKLVIDSLVASNGKFFRIGSHTIDVNGYSEFIGYVDSVSNDELLVSSTREVLEYREMATMPTIQFHSGDTLTISTDISVLDPKNRWKDQSFIINSDAEIISIETTSDSFSFNPSSGLVNTFQQNTYA